MKKIIILTATRAEYGLLAPVIKKLKEQSGILVKVVATGMHLSSEFGLTYKEIENDGIRIDKKIEILLCSDTSVSVSKSMGLALISFGEYFAEEKPDALLVLGDRYETMAVCCAAVNAQIPIIHMYGGETTEGAIDEVIRHSITKMSYLHFTSTELYRKRVIQLGEQPERVFNVGSVGVENALIIGNSSSGITEAPSFRIPTINIGNRQKGRIQAENTINCEPDAETIKKAIEEICRPEFTAKLKYVENPYWGNKTVEKITNIITDYLINNKITVYKQFYDIFF